MENLSHRLDGLISTRETAERLGVTVQKVHRLVTAHELTPELKLGGATGSYYFAVAAVEALAAKFAETEPVEPSDDRAAS